MDNLLRRSSRCIQNKNIISNGVTNLTRNLSAKPSSNIDRYPQVKVDSDGRKQIKPITINLANDFHSLDKNLIAYSIYQAISTNQLTHDEKLVYSKILQLVLQNANLDELDSCIKFHLERGFPLAIDEIFPEKASKDDLFQISKTIADIYETTSHHDRPFRIKADELLIAFEVLDTYVKQHLLS